MLFYLRFTAYSKFKNQRSFYKLWLEAQWKQNRPVNIENLKCWESVTQRPVEQRDSAKQREGSKCYQLYQLNCLIPRVGCILFFYIFSVFFFLLLNFTVGQRVRCRFIFHSIWNRRKKKNTSKKKNSFFIHSIDFTPKGEKNDLFRRKKKKRYLWLRQYILGYDRYVYPL